MSNADEIMNKWKASKIWNMKTRKEFFDQGLEADTREDYLAWVEEWRTIYKELSRDISVLKGMRKRYAYEYRAQGDKASKRRKVVGDNPRFDSDAQWIAAMLGFFAAMMMEARADAKIASIEHKKQKAAA